MFNLNENVSSNCFTFNTAWNSLRNTIRATTSVVWTISQQSTVLFVTTENENAHISFTMSIEREIWWIFCQRENFTQTLTMIDNFCDSNRCKPLHLSWDKCAVDRLTSCCHVDLLLHISYKNRLECWNPFNLIDSITIVKLLNVENLRLIIEEWFMAAKKWFCCTKLFVRLWLLFTENCHQQNETNDSMKYYYE